MDDASKKTTHTTGSDEEQPKPVASSTSSSSTWIYVAIALLIGVAVGVGIGAGVWNNGSSSSSAVEETEPAPTRAPVEPVGPEEPEEPSDDPVMTMDPFAYDPEISPHTMKTNSYMPFMPMYDGWMQTHHTYRFFSVREQVSTMIGEAKHGVWRIQDNGMVRLYRKAGAEGVPVGADVMDPDLLPIIERDYKAVLAPGEESGDDFGWSGYRYSQDADGDGVAAFVDVSIYHPYFGGMYDDHVAMDLPHWYCTMSGPKYPNTEKAWKFAAMQPNANKIGPLGQRAGLDIKEHYTNVIRFDVLPDAKAWVNVGMGDEEMDMFTQSDIDDGSMSMSVVFRALDWAKIDYEVYMIERPFFNVPYLFVTLVIDNKENDHMQYIRPDGMYWDMLVEKGMTEGLKTTPTYDPVMPVVEPDGTQMDKIMYVTPFYGLNHLDRPNDDGSGGWCPNKGGDWGSYPSQPGGAGFPNEYEEVTPACDGLVLDIKLWANLDIPSWDDPLFQLQNAGAQEEPLVYLGEGNKYGEFVDPYLVENGIINPHNLEFTDVTNPDPKPVQKISVLYEAIGTASKYVDMETGMTMGGGGLTTEEAESRASKIAAVTN